MPTEALSSFQDRVLRLLAVNQSEESHLAGGASIALREGALRGTDGLDYFHDKSEFVQAAFRKDAETLTAAGISLDVRLQSPGFIRAVASEPRSSASVDSGQTKIEWVYDSAWRFLPIQPHPVAGFVLHPVDVAINKVLACVGRDEARDMLDLVFFNQTHLPLGSMVWAAVAKDQGWTPEGIIDVLGRKRLGPDEIQRLKLIEPASIYQLKQDWLVALAEAKAFVSYAPKETVGCLFYDPPKARFFQPKEGEFQASVVHAASRGGVIPIIGDTAPMADELPQHATWRTYKLT